MKAHKVVLLLWATAAIEAFLLTDSCSGRCDDSPSSAHSCQCNSHCDRYGDCCHDYSSLCQQPQSSCAGRCGDNFSSDHACQCNSQCTRHSDCCYDYNTVCIQPTAAPEGSTQTGEISDAELKELGDQLWLADKERFQSSDISLDLRGDRLFSRVNEAKLRTTSYALFIALLDNYNPINDVQEPAFTSEEQTETSRFLDHVLDSDVMAIVERVLVRSGKVANGGMRGILQQLWFDFYGRSSSLNVEDSSGFEHVFIGEKKESSRKVSGFHSWVQMYELEKNGHLEYLSMNSQAEPNLMSIRLRWDGYLKDRASMFVGTSPEFDLAIYTLCMLARPGQACTTSIAGNDVNMQTYDVGHIPGLQVASAFPTL